MPFLRIQDIFANFQFYKENYLSILKNPQSYYQAVADAGIHFAILSEQKVYLGDLLQLWFGDKWTEHQAKQLQQGESNYWQPVQQDSASSDIFVFAIQGQGIGKHAKALAWSQHDAQIREIYLDRVLPYYFNFIALERPKHSAV
ncbi:hypothetical protein [Acinetobacter sp. ANC 4641]|uniref:hypothetical protein n=1 Tax=Acinetobacter sp. ANC 4641 TaxID=2529847 RepID=UPI00103FBCE7|nr:hypothetical protein [Acinetobacter sp. ANC 4641]TCB09638.1 hypothetical protein E0H78_10955 [Acinetobacter sp. ANC 4641]